jgi:glycosyltransferase involved in cell wall biosynthesis
VQLSVVVPAYREGPRIYDNLHRLLHELDQLQTDYEVVVVSDGNTDETASEAERVGSDRVKVLQYPVNHGKGFALTHGVNQSTGQLVTFIDADMELNPAEIRRFIELLHEQHADIVIGSKRHRLSRVHYPMFRRLQSFIYQLLIRLMFDVGVRDTQTGLKLFRREVLADALPLLAVKQFAFDLELLVVARHLGYTRVVEAPIELSYQFASTISPKHIFKILWDTAAIFYRLHITHYYERRAPATVEPAASANALRRPD